MPQNDPTQDAGLNSGAMTGVGEALGAYLWWGFITALYYKALREFPADELLAWRVLTGAPLMLILIAFPPGISRLKKTIRNRRNVGILAITTALIAINWFAFIYAVIHERLMEASLGYFINPLVLILLARVFLHERMRLIQSVSVIIATIGVIVFCCSFVFQSDEAVFKGFPWIALALPLSFSFYGLLRKQMSADAVTGLTVEMLLCLPIAIGFVIWLFSTGEPTVAKSTSGTQLLLLASGVVTIVPLICFSAAARRLRLSTVGLLQFIAPTCQFLLAVFAFGEKLDLFRIIAFVLIWIAIILYSIDSIRSARQSHALKTGNA
jgi:chloramphenicol-sensitive protein RarD